MMARGGLCFFSIINPAFFVRDLLGGGQTRFALRVRNFNFNRLRLNGD